MRCPYCGSEVPDTARACGHCGQWLAVGPAVPPPAAVPPKRSLPGWVWGLVGGAIVVVVVVVVVVGVLLAMGVISLPGRQTAAPPAIPTPVPQPTLPPIATLPVPTPTTVVVASPTSRPSPTVTPHVKVTSPPQKTVPPPPTEPPPERLPPTSTQWFPPTGTSAPKATPLTATPTPTTPVSTGPLDFPVPTMLDHWQQPLPDGKYECKIVLHITGGAPPYTVHHDVAVFTTWETNPEIVFTAHGCGAIVHTIKVESADGQVVSHGYWILAPWCGG